MDRYIDNDETQTYGPQFSRNVRRMFAGDDPAGRFIRGCADRLDAATEAMREAMAARRLAGAARSAAAEEKIPVVQGARDELRTLSLHIATSRADAQEPWKGDPEVFVPGGMVNVGKGAAGLYLALGVARRALHDDTAVPERAKWIRRLDAQLKALAPLVEQIERAGLAHRSALSEQSAEKAAWLRAYRGLAVVLEGALLLQGREREYTAAVPHLTAPGTRKKTDGAPNAPVGPVTPVEPQPA